MVMDQSTIQKNLLMSILFCIRGMEWYEKNENDQTCTEVYRELSKSFLAIAPAMAHMNLALVRKEDEFIEWELIGILKQIIAAIEMQLKRKTEEFLTFQTSAKIIWDTAIANGKKILAIHHFIIVK